MAQVRKEQAGKQSPGEKRIAVVNTDPREQGACRASGKEKLPRTEEQTVGGGQKERRTGLSGMVGDKQRMLPQQDSRWGVLVGALERAE